MPKSSFDVDASVPEPTGGNASARSRLPKSNFNSEMDYPDQGSSELETPGQGNRKKMTGPTQVVPGSASGDTSFIPQGSSKISQPPQVTAEDIDISDDVAAIFEGSDLSEEFKYKAHAIFEAAVVSKINEKLEEITNDLQEEIYDIQEQIAYEITEKVDAYLNYVVEEWMAENQLAVELGVKTEMTESFLRGLKTLFEDHYVDIPEDKTEVLDELVDRIDELESDLSEQIETNVSLNSRLIEFEKEMAFLEVSEGLTEIQTAKLESLAESISFTNSEDFKERLESLKESYFPSSSYIYESSNVNFENEEEYVDISESTVRGIDPGVRTYVDAISRTVKK
jgi:hypothetical protein